MSEWRPGRGQGTTVSTPDLAMAMVALANYARHVHGSQDNVALAERMLRRQAEFLVDALQATDGSVADGYEFAARDALGGRPTLLAQGFAIRGLIEAHKQLGDDRYLEAARRIYAFMNASLWDDQTGVYRSAVGAATTEYTPLNV